MSTSDLLLDPSQQNPAFTLPEQWSDSSDDSDVETPKTDDAPQQEQQQPQQVEWLATSRAKRSTAGNRMKSMLANEEPAAEDSDLELLFAEDEDDAGFTDDDKEDASDVQMDSSSDDEDDKDGANVDDLEGEKELERQAREKKAAQRKRKAQEAIPMKFRKKVRIEQPPSATGDSAAGSPAPSTTGGTPAASSVRQGPVPKPPRPKKKSERISWLPTPADMPTRASERRTTKMSKEQLHQKMIEDEIRRKKLLEKMEKAAKRAEAMKKPPMTQAERLAEAALVEKRNEKSLNRWEEAEKVREEERLRKIAALNNRKLDGPVVTFWSGIQTLEEGQQKHVGKMVSMEEKPVRRKRQSVSATLAAQEAAEKEKAKAEEAAKQTPSTEKADIPLTEAPTKEVPKQETSVDKACSLAAVPEKPKEPISTPDVVMKDAPEPQQQTPPPQPSQPAPKPLTLAPLRGPMAPPPIPPPPPPVETKTTHSSGVLAAPVLAPPAGVAPPMLDAQMPGLAFPFSNGMSNVLAPPNTTSPLSMPASSGGRSAPTPAPAPAPPVMSAPVTPAPTTNLTFAPAHIPAPIPPRDATSPAATVITTTIQTKQAPTPPSSQVANVSPEKSIKETTLPALRQVDKDAKDGKAEESSKDKPSSTEKGPDGPKEVSTTQSGQPAAEGEEEKTVNKVTRSCIILQNFDEAAIKDKQVQTQIIFGRRMEKLAKPAHPPICVVTGHPARYRDPKTGLPYYNAYAYREIQRVHRGDYKFSALLGAYVGSQTYAAKGVPERFLNPNGKRSTPKENPAMIAKRKEAEEAEKKKKEEEKLASEKKTKDGAGDLDKKLDEVQATALPPLREPKLALHLPRRASGTDVPKARSKSKETTTPHDHLKRKSSTSSLPAKMTGPVVQAELEPIEGLTLPLPPKAGSVPAHTPTLSSTSKSTPSAPAAAVPRKASPLQLSTPPLQTQAQFKLVDDLHTQPRLQAPPTVRSTSSSAQSTPQTSKAPSPVAEVPVSAPTSNPTTAPASVPAPAQASTAVPAQAQPPTRPNAPAEPAKKIEPAKPAETPQPPAPTPAPSAPVAEPRFQFAPAPGSDKPS
ncbi:YL1 nuclear protein-domain-containing protein [Sordaria brevicollis]|uniref:YL1 nuclear protein-domain-containing protein n=1 Tax=Sordaria brevicollis TaxID=83679 RepID=A0AAE0PJP3_SORBR|nr:YL1 nuclear protein-domain-containing protein [Sordaria brevicollis]